jgi:putative transposase
MGATPRVDVAGLVYHVWNRGNAGGQLFVADKDYQAFEYILIEAKMKVDMPILAYCIMPNHWHFVLQPKHDGDLGTFFHWLTVTHAKRWHMVRGSTGAGHIYQGTYKSNVCQDDTHTLRLIRYVERNALRANLVKRAEDWRWSSGWRRLQGSAQQRSLLAAWPIAVPSDYSEHLNTPQTVEELDEIRLALRRGSPYGAGMWQDEMIDRYKLQATIRSRGRPKKET